jgi:hypothetical protein
MDQRQVALAEQAQRIKDNAERKIWVTFRKEGIHRYPAAATDPNLATGDEYDVSFLASPHRHIFHFRVWIDVFHNDRDIEFIQFKRWIESLYNGHTTNNNNQGSVLELDFKSCEMLADDLYDQIAARYPERAVWIEVAEDGENGCLIKYELTRPNLSIKY